MPPRNFWIWMGFGVSAMVPVSLRWAVLSVVHHGRAAVDFIVALPTDMGNALAGGRCGLVRVAGGDKTVGMARGTLRIFLGAAAGAGTTYSMLREAHRLLAGGRDVA